MDKRAFRAAVRAKIAALEPEYLAESDEGIRDRLFALPEFREAGTVFAYFAMGREIATEGIIERALALGKRVCLPRSHEGGVMDFADFSGGLRPARFGLMEPDAGLSAVEPAEGDIILVPALCCAPDGRRQGQGGGYYDRFLARYPKATSACLARERLLDEGVPAEWNDLRPDYVITEERIISPERRAAISLADGARHAETLRALIREYTASLGRDISFQRPEEELAAIESIYAPPGGAAVVAMRGGEGIGMACLRRIDSVRCEMKRLYVRREYRSLRLGEALARGIIERARALGYGELLLDTLEDMHAARRLYARLGFSECAPYYDNPLPGTSYMRLALK